MQPRSNQYNEDSPTWKSRNGSPLETGTSCGG